MRHLALRRFGALIALVMCGVIQQWKR